MNAPPVTVVHSTCAPDISGHQSSVRDWDLISGPQAGVCVNQVYGHTEQAVKRQAHEPHEANTK